MAVAMRSPSSCVLLPYLKLLPTGGAQEVFAVRVPEHVESQLVGATEGLVTFCALVDLLRVEAAHVFFHLAMKTMEKFRLPTLEGAKGSTTTI